MQEPGFWDDQERAARVSAEHSRAQRKLDGYRSLESDLDDLEALEELADEDRSIAGEVAEQRAGVEARLGELEEQRRREELAREKGEAQDVGWGSQIRSYVLHPYTMVKDHRTNYEMGDAQRVLDGDLDGFVRAELLRRAGTSAAGNGG